MLKQRSPFAIFAGFTLSVLGGMMFNVGGLFAGRTAILLQNLQSEITWIFLLYPLLLTVRGDINGILSGKLGTALHLGTIKPNWRKNTERFKQLISFILILTVFDAFLVGLVAYIIGLLIPSITIKFIEVVSVSITTFLLSAMISLFLTFTLTFFIFNKKGDPDVYVYPIMSSVNDIFITVIFLGSSYFYKIIFPAINISLIVGLPIFLIAVVLVMFLGVYWRRESYIKEGIKQSLPTLSLTNLIAAGTGVVLASFQNILSLAPLLLIAYPAIISTIGGQGSILANTTTTKLHLGTIKPSFNFFRTSDFFNTFFGIIVAGIILNTIYSLISIGLRGEPITSGAYFLFLIVIVLTNILSFILAGLISLTAAFLTYRFGLDPDNLVNPILSSTADLITTSILVLFAILLII